MEPISTPAKKPGLLYIFLFQRFSSRLLPSHAERSPLYCDKPVIIQQDDSSALTMSCDILTYYLYCNASLLFCSYIINASVTRFDNEPQKEPANGTSHLLYCRHGGIGIPNQKVVFAYLLLGNRVGKGEKRGAATLTHTQQRNLLRLQPIQVVSVQIKQKTTLHLVYQFFYGGRRHPYSLLLRDASVYCVLADGHLSVIHSMTWIISRLPVLLAIVQKVRISKELETNRMAKDSCIQKLTLSFLLPMNLLHYR